MTTFIPEEQKITAHFRAGEFGMVPVSQARNLRRLCDALERLRKLKGGKPLRIVSGYRSVQHNAQVGGAKQSQHLTASAADIPASYGVTVGEAQRAGFTGIGVKQGRVIHVDVRPGQTAQWWY